MIRVARIVLLFALVSLVVLAGPVRAQSSQPGADQLAAARAFVDVMGMSEQMAAVMPVIFKQLGQVMIAQKPADRAVIEEAMTFLAGKMANRTGEVVVEITTLYAEQVPLEDLKTLTAFFQTPAGQRFVTLQPQLTQMQMQIGQRWGQRVAVDAQKELAEYLRKRGVAP